MSDNAKDDAGKEARFTPDEVIAKQRNRQLFVLSAIVIVLAGFVLLTRQFKDEESPLKDVLLAGGKADEASFGKDDVRRIEIWKGPEGEKLVLNRDGDDWRVPGRFNAPADDSDIDALLLQVLESRRLNRASTQTQAQYAQYRLDDKNAVHLRLTDDKGEELLHVMVGRSETGARDFVRLTGEDAPEGIFELTGAGGDFNTLYSTLNLDSNGAAQSGRWVSTKGFKPLPFTAIVQSLTIKDGGSEITFERRSGSDETREEWELVRPQRVAANGEEVRSVIDALMNYNASDIAGRDTDAQKFEFMQKPREVVLTYRDDPDLKTVRIIFGKQNDDNEVAVWLKAADRGEFIYWAGDFILSRLFRPKSDFLKRDRVKPVPDGAEIQNLTVLNEGTTLELQREKQGASVSWRMLQPWQGNANRLEVNNLLTSLNTLQGYRTEGEADHDALGVAPGIAEKVITLRYSGAGPGGDRDGQDAEDPSESQPEDPQPRPDTPPLKTATLYFGKTERGEVPVLLVNGEAKQLYWVAESVLERLFVQPITYVEPETLNPIAESWSVQEVRRVNGEQVTQAVYEDVAEGGGKRWMLKAPVEEMAVQSEALALIQEVKALQGVPQPGLDKEEYGLGEGVSIRTIDLRLAKDGETQIVSLYFGKQKWGRTTLLLSAGGEEKLYVVDAAAADKLFNRVLQDYNVKVRHILISWMGLGVPMKEPGRTKEQAHELATQVLQRYRDGEDFVELQVQFNEDSDPTAVYDVNPQAGLVEPFKRLSASLKVDEADIVESRFGYHVIKRIE